MEVGGERDFSGHGKPHFQPKTDKTDRQNGSLLNPWRVKLMKTDDLSRAGQFQLSRVTAFLSDGKKYRCTVAYPVSVVAGVSKTDGVRRYTIFRVSHAMRACLSSC